MVENIRLMTETALRISGVNPKKCMKCGKCSGACPNYDRMEYHPHQFVSMVENGLGISVLPELLLKRHSQNIVAVPVDPPFTRTIILAAPSFDTCSPAAAKFMSYIKDFCKNEAD